tara:strand:- start:827 stop:1576 length:750 start_codon:yes stop_codon:yes gene_type:complete
MSDLPNKLNKDAILEALCEVWFECEESVSLPEAVVGQLAKFDPWKDFERVRLPISDIPISIRLQDPNLKNKPTLELRTGDGSQIVKIGANVLSYHRLIPYPGWSIFKPEIDRFIDFLFDQFRELKVTRLGFRYVNGFTEEHHGIQDVRNLNFSVELAGAELEDQQNLNYRKALSDSHFIVVRIASPEFLAAPSIEGINALVDVDVFTPPGWGTENSEAAKDWVESAHTFEKEEFFKLFSDEMKDRMVAE